jgi:hypothetical protein
MADERQSVTVLRLNRPSATNRNETSPIDDSKHRFYHLGTNVVKREERPLKDPGIRLSLVDGRRLSIELEKLVNRRLRGARRVFDGEDDVLRHLA